MSVPATSELRLGARVLRGLSPWVPQTIQVRSRASSRQSAERDVLRKLS